MDIKVHYQMLGGEESVAYVNEYCPHIGEDKWTMDDIQLYFDGSMWKEIWFQDIILGTIPKCYCKDGE